MIIDIFKNINIFCLQSVDLLGINICFTNGNVKDMLTTSIKIFIKWRKEIYKYSELYLCMLVNSYDWDYVHRFCKNNNCFVLVRSIHDETHSSQIYILIQFHIRFSRVY